MIRKLLLSVCIVICLCGALPAMAQDGGVRVKCDRYTINVPSTNARCFRTAGNIPVSETASPEEIEAAQVANTAIAFIDYEKVTSWISPQVVFYSVDDLAKTSFDLLDIATEMSDMMNNINAEYATVQDVYQNVPFLPYQSRQRTVNALPEKIDFTGGSGIRTIAVFGESIESTSSSANLYYSFQGVSSDGNLYISAVFPIRSSILNGQAAAGVSWDAETVNSFVPSIEELDFYVKSLVIE